MSDGAPGDDPERAAGVLAEVLAESFARRRPQGSLRWNYEVAFALLDEQFGSGEPDPLALPEATETGGTRRRAEGPVDGRPDGTGGHSTLRGLVRRAGLARLGDWVEGRAEAAAAAATEQALREGLGRSGVAQSVEALRFLGQRVAELEAAQARRRTPVRAVEQLAPSPPVAPWVATIVGFLEQPGTGAPVLHAECGDGALVEALRARGTAASGAEPRGPLVWAAAERGVRVALEGAREQVAAAERGSLGGLVLSGIVDRAPLEDLVELVGIAAERLSPGGALVVLSASPDQPAVGWGAVARDLLPGRPLHPETWPLLLEGAGLVDPSALNVPPRAEGYAVAGRLPR